MDQAKRVLMKAVPLLIGVASLPLLFIGAASSATASEAPAGFDDQTNGYLSQAQHDKDRKEFDKQATIQEGLGPVYTARSCNACALAISEHLERSWIISQRGKLLRQFELGRLGGLKGPGESEGAAKKFENFVRQIPEK